MLDEARAVGAIQPYRRETASTSKPDKVRRCLLARTSAEPVTMEARNYGLARHYDPVYRVGLLHGRLC